MMLELDCGNTLIKWRLIDTERPHAGKAADVDGVLQDLRQAGVASLRGIRLVSVRGEAETAEIRTALERTFHRPCRVAQPARELGGVRNGYQDYQALGMDRWLSVVGAYSLARKACLVIDLGTAITADFVSAQGEHLGGFICPGMPLMRKELTSHTGRIRYEHAEPLNPGVCTPGRGTAQAVEGGCFWMIRGFVHEQCRLAKRLLDDDHEVLLTGGDAHMVFDAVPGARLAPDLVFAGLAIACPIE
ncbi:MAG TPA: type III pantothenate kinase [Burkholderiaceae bacterium]|nr:type III pantothenate kinase [Burkholderiaceae bacterium]